MSERILLSVAGFAQKHQAFSQASLRNLIFHAGDRYASGKLITGNGFGACLVRIGRKILIDEARFFAWLDAQNGGPK